MGQKDVVPLAVPHSVPLQSPLPHSILAKWDKSNQGHLPAYEILSRRFEMQGVGIFVYMYV